MTTVEAGKVVIRLEGKDVNLTQLLEKINRQVNTNTGTLRKYDQQMATMGPNLSRLESRKLSYARALALVAEKQGDSAEAARILNTELLKVAPNTTAAQRALLQLQQTLDRQTAATQAARKASGQMLTDFAGGFNKLLGAYFAVTQVAQGIGSLIEAGNQLEKTQTTFKALSVTPEEYARNLAIAREQQDQFGGSLEQNLDQMSGFIFTARNAGVSLKDLTNIARKLAIIDPAQGFKGASIALKEFFSGDITSLARRFELPRDMLHGIDDLASGAEKIQALNAALNQMGITNELIESQSKTIAVEYDKMWGEIQDGVANTGKLIASVLLPVLREVGDTWKSAFGDTANIGALSEIPAKTQALSSSFLTSTTSLDAYNKKVQEYNELVAQTVTGSDNWLIKFGPLTGAINALLTTITQYNVSLAELTPQQYAAAQSLIQTGVSAEQAIAKVQEYAGVIEAFTSTSANLGNVYNETTPNVDNFRNSLIELALTSAENSDVAFALNNAVADGQMTMQEATAILMQLIAGHRAEKQAQEEARAAKEANTAATSNAITATSIFTQELANNALEQVNAQVQSEALKLRQEALYNAALLAANGLDISTSAAAALATQFGITTQEAYGLINALAQLQQARAAQALGLPGVPASKHHAFYSKAPDVWIKQKDALEKAKKAEQDFNRTQGDTAQQLAYARAELEKTTEGTEEYWNARKRVRDLEEKLDNEGKRKGKSGSATPKLTANEKLANKLLAQEDKLNNQLEDAERKHMENLVQIYEDYNKKILEQQKRNEINKRRSRVSFYEDNAELPEGLDPSIYAAQYEQAFLEAQKIAQEGSAQLAQEYLEMRQAQIEELRKLDEEAANIQADENLSEKEKQAALEYLEGRRKLIQDAQAEETKQLLEGGDAINKELAERLSEEEKMYAENVDKIILHADRAADAQIAAAERARIKITEQNRALAEQLAITKGIADNYSRLPGASLPSTPLPTAPASGVPAIPAPASATTAAAIIVQQDAVWRVADEAAILALQDISSRLEQKLDAIVAAVDNANRSITGAVNRIKTGNGSVISG